MKWHRLALVVGALFLTTSALADVTPIQTLPSSANSGEASGTISTTNLFQVVWAQATVLRKGCLVLNNSTDRQWVYFQGTGMATPTSANEAAIKAESVPLEPASATNALGGYVTCNAGTGSTLQDAIWIAGTSGDTFVAKQQ